MSTKTTNYNLIKPELTDTADITEMNQNWDIIDEELKTNDTHINNKNNPHGVTAEQVGALPLTGGTLTGNQLWINNGTGLFESDGFGTYLSHYASANDKTNGKYILLSSKNTVALGDALKIAVKTNGITKTYKLFGEHNKPTASDVGAVACSTPMTLSVTSNGILQITY